MLNITKQAEFEYILRTHKAAEVNLYNFLMPIVMNAIQELEDLNGDDSLSRIVYWLNNLDERELLLDNIIDKFINNIEIRNIYEKTIDKLLKKLRVAHVQFEIKNKKEELTNKLRKYAKHINLNKYFINFINNLWDELVIVNNINVQGLEQIINVAQPTFKRKIKDTLIDCHMVIRKIFYSYDENVDEFIRLCKIDDMPDEILDLILMHFHFIY